jgi:hypothetical protein
LGKFNDLLQAQLTLVTAETTTAIPAGSIEAIDLHVYPYGFTAEVSFWVSSEGVADALFKPFTSTALIQATLSIANGRVALAGGVPIVADFLGFVTERSVQETTSEDIAGEPIIERLYSIHFADAAKVFWSQHRPLALYANSSLQGVIDKHAVTGTILSYDWSELGQIRDIICVGVGGAGEASFYDFVMWLVDDMCGVVEFDPATSSYRIAKEKISGGTLSELEAGSVASLVVQLPTLRRHASVVLNPFSGAMVGKTDVANAIAVTGVRHEAVAHSAIPTIVDARTEIEKRRLRQRDHHLHVEFAELPSEFPGPGSLRKVGEGFSTRLMCAGKSYRSIGLHMKAGMPDGEEDASDWEDEACRFGIELQAEFERDSDPVGVLPKHGAPTYPVLAEGKVLSASGTASDRTWHALASDVDSLARYRINVPLWNQTVIVPFVPFGESGHFFFPAYKNQRVLLAFDFDRVRIVSFLDWAGKLSTDSQGNQIVMGKRDASSTVMKHAYTDDSPTLSIVRTQAGDKQTMELSEGRFFLEVKEDTVTETTDETYDLSPLAEIAKESAGSEARGSIATLSTKYQSKAAGTTAVMNSAAEEVEGSVTDAATELSDSVAKVESALSSKAADVAASAEELAAAVEAARAKLKKALDD